MTNTSGPSNHEIWQNAYVVDDIWAEMEKWRTVMGVGPFFLAPHLQPEKVLYRGSPASLEMSVALAQAGGVIIELIQVHSTDPCAYRDSASAGSGSVFHHVCTFSEDFEADCAYWESQGCPIATRAELAAPFAYSDTRHLFGVMTEFVPLSDGLRFMIDTTKGWATDWDGQTDPVRIPDGEGGYISAKGDEV